MSRLLLIDNYDSFTYNLYQYLCELGADVSVVRNDALTVDDASVADVRTHVRAVGIEDHRFAAFGAERNQILTEQAQRHDGSGRQRGRLERQVPAGRIWPERISIRHA